MDNLVSQIYIYNIFIFQLFVYFYVPKRRNFMFWGAERFLPSTQKSSFLRSSFKKLPELLENKGPRHCIQKKLKKPI